MGLFLNIINFIFPKYRNKTKKILKKEIYFTENESNTLSDVNTNSIYKSSEISLNTSFKKEEIYSQLSSEKSSLTSGNEFSYESIPRYSSQSIQYKIEEISSQIIELNPLTNQESKYNSVTILPAYNNIKNKKEEESCKYEIKRAYNNIKNKKNITKKLYMSRRG